MISRDLVKYLSVRRFRYSSFSAGSDSTGLFMAILSVLTVILAGTLAVQRREDAGEPVAPGVRGEHLLPGGVSGGAELGGPSQQLAHPLGGLTRPGPGGESHSPAPRPVLP